MEALDCDGRFLDGSREHGFAVRLPPVALQRHIGAGGEIRAPAVTAFKQPLPRHLRRLVFGLAHDGIDRVLVEPSTDFVLDCVEIKAVGFVI